MKAKKLIFLPLIALLSLMALDYFMLSDVSFAQDPPMCPCDEDSMFVANDDTTLKYMAGGASLVYVDQPCPGSNNARHLWVYCANETFRCFWIDPDGCLWFTPTGHSIVDTFEMETWPKP